MAKGDDIRKSFVRYAIVATALFLVFLVIKKDSVISWIQAGFTIRQQDRQIELLQGQIRDLDRKIELMSADRDSLETFAREEFFFAEPGEDVYITDEK